MRAFNVAIWPSTRFKAIFPALVLWSVGAAPWAHAQQAAGDYCTTAAEATGLCGSSVYASFNAFEKAAAAANQATFDRLDESCGPNRDAVCTATQQAVYEAAREFVHTANALSGDPFLPTEFSLELDQEGLGFALRWSAAEEMAAHGAITNRFASSQLAVLAARIASLRWGGSGVRMAQAGSGGHGQVLLASLDASAAAAAAGQSQWIAGRWSGFVDAAFGWGDRKDTTFATDFDGFENAFDFDAMEITVGTDYRFTTSLVAGAMFGYSDKRVDFDSSKSIVDGDIDATGYSLQFYMLREGDRAHLSASLGYQQLEHDVRRRIVYPSNNPNLPSSDSTALSSTDSKTLLATLGAGYQFHWGGLAAEPYVDVQYTDTRVDGFTEQSFSNTGEAGPDPFALVVGRQDIDSLNLSLGLRVQYVLTPKFGVVVPYLRGAYHRETRDDARLISTRYAGAADVLTAVPGSDFSLATDKPDSSYYTVAAGFSFVLPRGLQGFVQYLDVIDLDFYNQAVVSAGVRMEF